MNGYEALAIAIVAQAVKDYRSAQIRLRQVPKDEEAPKTLLEIEAFCRSRWFKELSDFNGETLLQKLKEGRF